MMVIQKSSCTRMFMYEQENKHLMYTTVNSARMPFHPSYNKRNVEDDRSANAKSAETDNLIKQNIIESRYLQSKVINRKETQKLINVVLYCDVARWKSIQLNNNLKFITNKKNQKIN